MNPPLFLGLDIGTSSLKALITDASGSTISGASEDYPLDTPQLDWSQQHPDHWVRAAHLATRAAIAHAPSSVANCAARIAGIGFSGQMHGATFVDRNNHPLSPCILWNDSRSAAECEELEQFIGARNVLARTGNRLLPGFTAPKVRWLQKHAPDLWAKTDCILLPKDYVRMKLGSARATDVSDASGTLYFDVAQRKWSQEMLIDLGIKESQVPTCFESPETVDQLSAAAAQEMGLTAGIPLMAGAGDQAANALGSGIVNAGAVAVSLGTSGVIFAATDTFRASPDGALHAFCHALPGRWHLMSVMLSAGGSLRWFRDTLARDLPARAAAASMSVYQLLDRDAASVAPGCDGLRFLPTLAGERCPFPDPHAKGAFLGMSLSHTQAHFARAVLEGVAASMGLCMQMIQDAGIRPGEVIGSGGGFASDLWTQMHADAFNLAIRRASTPDSAARGAAILACLGTGALTKEQISVPPSGEVVPANSSTYHHYWQGLMESQRFLQRNVRSST